MTTRCFVVALLFSALCLAACSPGERPGDDRGQAQRPQPVTATASAGAERPKLTAPKVTALCTVNWAMAREKGFFSAEGMDVEMLPPDMSAGLEHAFSMVMGPGGPMRADLTVIEHAHLVDVVSGKLPYYVVAGEHSGCHQLVVPVRSPIQTMADLKNKRIGLPSIEDTGPWDYLARQAGLQPEALRWVRPAIVPGGNEELEYAKREFAAGRLDAYVTSDPVGEIMKAEGHARHVASNTWTPPVSGWYCCMVGIRRDRLDRHPALARAVARAMRRSAAFVERSPAEAVALGVKGGYLTSDIPQALSARLLGEYIWTGTARIEEDLERYFQLLIEGGKLPPAPPPRELVKRVYRSGE